jgi:DnaJ-domain-containing protein 1
MDRETKDILERPFAQEDIKKDYDGFDHVEPQLVVRRLNEAFGQDGWQFVPEQIMEMNGL